MKKTAIGIGVLAVLLGALIVALFALSGGEGEELPEALRELDRVFDFAAPVRSVRVEQAGREPFTLENVAADPGEVEGTLAGREHLPVDRAKVTAVLRAAGNLPYTQLVHEAADDYAPFGLEAPAAKLTIKTADEGVTLLAGDIAPDGTGRYVKLADGSAIYLVPVYTLDNYFLSEYDYLDHTVTPTAGFPLRFERMTLSGGGRDEDIVVVPAGREGYCRLEAPVSHELDGSAGFSAVSAVFGMQSGNIAKIDLTGQEIVDLGLDEPWAAVAVESAALGSFAVRVSAPDVDGHVFLYREGVPVLYTAAAEELPWLTASWFDLISKLAFAPELSEVETLSAGVSGFIYLRDCKATGEGKDLAVTGTWMVGESGQSGTLNAKKFLDFYEVLTAATFLEPADEASLYPGASLDAEFTLKTGETHVVKFYASTQPRRLLIQVDDGPYFYITEEYALTLYDLLLDLVRSEYAKAAPAIMGPPPPFISGDQETG